MLIPSKPLGSKIAGSSLSRRVNANSQHTAHYYLIVDKLIKKGEC